MFEEFKFFDLVLRGSFFRAWVEGFKFYELVLRGSNFSELVPRGSRLSELVLGVPIFQNLSRGV